VELYGYDAPVFSRIQQKFIYSNRITSTSDNLPLGQMVLPSVLRAAETCFCYEIREEQHTFNSIVGSCEIMNTKILPIRLIEVTA
jgi:hypothetical protein